MEETLFYLLSLSSTLLFIFFLFSIHHQRHQNPRKPSPPTLPSIPIIGHLRLLKPPLHRSLARLSALHGPLLLLRFGSRPTLVISSPSIAQSCFTNNDLTFANRPRLIAGKILGYNYTSFVWVPYGPLWRNLRRIATVQLFSSVRISEFAPIRAKQVRTLIKNLNLRYGISEGFERVGLKEWLFDLTYGVMMEMIGAEEEDTWGYREIVEESFKVSGATNLGDFVSILRWLGIGGFEKRLRKLRGKRDEFLGRMIERRRRKKKGLVDERKCVIDVMLELQEEEPHYYTDEIIKGMIVVRFTCIFLVYIVF